MSNTELAEKIKEYIQAREEAKLATLVKAEAAARKKLGEVDDVVRSEFELNAKEKMMRELANFEVNRWLCDASTRAKEIQMITHAPKYTHGGATGNGVYSDNFEREEPKQYLISTFSIEKKQIDIIGNAAALAIGALLQLEEGGETLLDQIEAGDATALNPFAENNDQVVEWMEGFSQALKPKELSSHKLSKQMYFPISQKGYHVISPLFATSLSHVIYERLMDNRFSEEAKELRKYRREEKYTGKVLEYFPGLAVQSFGGSNQQNISKLNSVRGGRSFLFSTQPPEWSNINSPPVGSINSFWKAYERRCWPVVKALREYLERIEHRNSTLSLREIRADYVDELVLMLLQFAAEIQNMSAHCGWSDNSRLPLSEQYWLDPYRDDTEFQEQREKRHWIDEVAQTFSRWLNSELNRSKALNLGDVEFTHWKTTLEGALRDDLRNMS